ncbi:hypothetical protein SAMN02745127_01857 [Oceanospirillum multiglobuliferum]|nr:hypothetical protein SAMN02745127_01857 [Oceanospirillum multiglobuliferum]
MSKSLKAGSLCKLDKSDISKHLKELAEITQPSHYICGKCARSARDKKWLCRPLSTI